MEGLGLIRGADADGSVGRTGRAGAKRELGGWDGAGTEARSLFSDAPRVSPRPGLLGRFCSCRLRPRRATALFLSETVGSLETMTSVTRISTQRVSVTFQAK